MLDSAPAERVAAKDAPDRHPATDQRAAGPDGLLGVHRARGVEPALTTQPAGERHPVEPDPADDGSPQGSEGNAKHAPRRGHGRAASARRSNSVISATRSCILAPRMPCLATRTMS